MVQKCFSTIQERNVRYEEKCFNGGKINDNLSTYHTHSVVIMMT